MNKKALPSQPNSLTKVLLTLALLINTVSFSSFAKTANPEIKKHNTHAIVDKITIPAFTANYTILHKSDPIGKGIRKLEYLDDGTIKYSYSTDSKWFIITDKRDETTIIKQVGNNVLPYHYSYIREGTGKDKRYEWQYDPEKNTAINLEKNQKFNFDFSQNLQNPLSYHFQHRLKLIENQQNHLPNDSIKNQYSYQVIKTSGAIKSYDFVYDGKEELILPYGLVETVRFKREVPKKKRVTYIWFAPKLDYLMVRLYQVKAGNGKLEAQLTSVTVD